MTTLCNFTLSPIIPNNLSFLVASKAFSHTIPQTNYLSLQMMQRRGSSLLASTISGVQGATSGVGAGFGAGGGRSPHRPRDPNEPQLVTEDREAGIVGGERGRNDHLTN